MFILSLAEKTLEIVEMSLNNSWPMVRIQRLSRLLGIFSYLFDVFNKRLLLIGMYFDAELISEVDVNLGTP